jgi:hypothetical protein
MKLYLVLIVVFAFFVSGFLSGAVVQVAAQTPVVYRDVNDSNVNGYKLMYDIIQLLLPNKQLEVQPGETPNPVPTGTPVTATSIKNLRGLLEEIALKTGTPARILEGVFIVESPSLFNSITDTQVQTYSQPGGVVPNCTKNSCSAAGVMQFTTGVDNAGSSSCSSCCSGGKCLNKCPNAWSEYRDSINKFGGYAHQSNICNLRDNVYGAGAKLKADSGNKGGAWTKAQVTQAITRYYGACDTNHVYKRLGNRTYCDFVWWYYSSS